MATKTAEKGAAATTATAASAALLETPDALGRLQRLVQFYDVGGEPVPSWCAPLPLYLEAYEGLNPFAEYTHRLVVARAILHHLPVPEAVAAGHDARLLEEVVATEGRLHGPMPNRFCTFCSPPENVADGGEAGEASRD